MEVDILADINPTGEILGQEDRKENVQINTVLFGEDDPLGYSPPDFALAWKHSDAHKVKNSKLIGDSNKNRDDEEMFCPWWKAPTSKAVPKYSLCTSAKKLDNLGLGFPLYYQLKIFISIIYAVMIIVITIAGVTINAVRDRGYEWVGGATATFPVKMSIGNYGKSSSNYNEGGILAESILNLLLVFALLFGSIILRRIQNKAISQLNEENVTPSDFWVMVTGIPHDKEEKDVKEYFKTIDPDVEIVYINYWYKIKQIVKASRKIKKLENMAVYIEKYKANKLKKLKITEKEAENTKVDLHPPPIKVLCYKKEYPKKDKLIEDLKVAKEELEEIKKFNDANSDVDLFCGTAFVVWNKQNEINKLIQLFSVPFYKQIINFLFYKILRCKNSKIDSRYWEGKRIYVERASEPTDVYWENLDESTRKRLKKMSITYLVTAVCLGIAFWINYGLNALKNSFSSSNKSTSTSEATAIRAIAIITSLVVIFLNVALGRVVRILSAFENHETYSKYHLSVSIKLASVMFINTGILPMFVNWGKENWYDSGGLMDCIFYNTLSVCFVGPIFYYINPTYVVQRIKMWIEQCKGKKSKLTQRQANELFMGPNVDMAQRYANTALLLFLTVFYCFPLPIMPALAFFGTVFQYWLEKYLLLRRHRFPEQMGTLMAKTLSNSIPYVCFLYGLSLFVFTNIMSNGNNIVGLIAFIFAIAFILVPVRMILEKCFKTKSNKAETTYDEHWESFRTDYDRNNPMTANDANIKHLEKLKAEGKIDEESFNKQKNILKSADRFEAVVNYGQSSNTLQERVKSTYQTPILSAFSYPQYQIPSYGYYQPNIVVAGSYSNPIYSNYPTYAGSYYPYQNPYSYYNQQAYMQPYGVMGINPIPQPVTVRLQSNYPSPSVINGGSVISQVQVAPQLNYVTTAPQAQYYSTGMQYQVVQPQYQGTQVIYR